MPSQSDLTISPSLLIRWYIDTRSLTSSSSSLPLLSTLQEEDQTRVKAFYHLADRHMSLASYLLKYFFIHRACRVPWDEIHISRTPAPHKRPCYIPLQKTTSSGSGERGNGGVIIPNVEFNVSHQASLVALAGCIVPSGAGTSTNTSTLDPNPSSSKDDSSIPQIGIDITCTDDPSRRHRDSFKTEEELRSFIDIFAEVFSTRELDVMKSARPPRPAIDTDNNQHTGSGNDTLQSSIKYRLRLFYTYWALKEAYIKMTGEALLAPWLRELEFRNVTVPSPPMKDNDDHGSPVWGVPETGIEVWLHGERVRDVRIEVVAFGDNYLFATAGRGAGFGTSVGKRIGSGSDGDAATWGDFRMIGIEGDIGPCATGKCSCLVF